ncbi:MAG: efflux RND transporter periplasmic adaptor subunit [Proteobacteria bacterium]|nr:efflux RND transporter periplasmic adaptor subunit [Pseudomonadota bacterium]MBU1716645.1 efflux RND transporter periplasmic adaptor subunit [Pseudomonadota bacterium]
MSEHLEDHYKYPPDLPIPIRPWWQRLIAIGMILTILIIGVSVAWHLIKTKPQAKRKPPEKMQTLVRTTTLARVSTTLKITALGIVTPAQEVNLQAEVSGRVTALHPALKPGGIIKKDEIVIRIDDTDYQLNLQQKINKLEQAKADFQLEEGSQEVARQEWRLITEEGIDTGETSQELALRKPQLDKVLANIKTAENEIEQARISLARTELKAPFNGVVRQKNVALGSQISAQSSIAVLAETDTFWAEISVPVDQLQWLTLPVGEKPGSPVTIYTNGNTRHQGSLIKLLPDLDKDGLMARLLIAITDPLGLKSTKTPLFLGSFIRAEIEGRRLENVFQVPRAALVDYDKVLTVTAENTLHLQPVSVVWKNTEDVFIDQGLSAGDKLIISNVPAPIEGMPLDLNGDTPPREQSGQ